MRQAVSLKDLKPEGYRAQVEGTKSLTGEDGVRHGSWAAMWRSNRLPAISRKHLGTKLEAIKRHTNH